MGEEQGSVTAIDQTLGEAADEHVLDDFSGVNPCDDQVDSVGNFLLCRVVDII